MISELAQYDTDALLYFLKTSDCFLCLSKDLPPTSGKEREERTLHLDLEMHTHAVYGHAPLPAKPWGAVHSEMMGLELYPEKESMTEGRCLVTRMLISALLLKILKIRKNLHAHQ